MRDTPFSSPFCLLFRLITEVQQPGNSRIREIEERARRNYENGLKMFAKLLSITHEKLNLFPRHFVLDETDETTRTIRNSRR
jgi:hypothetical protein